MYLMRPDPTYPALRVKGRQRQTMRDAERLKRLLWRDGAAKSGETEKAGKRE